MKADRDFSRMRAAVLIALVLSVAALTLVCIIPQLVMDDLERGLSPALASAKEKAHSEEPSDALMDIVFIRKKLDAEREKLMALFSHGEIVELMRAARAAEAIAPTGDAAQLLAELTALETALSHLSELNRTTLANLF